MGLGLGPWEMGALLIIAVLLFGSRLPEVGRSIGKSIIEFKKGMRDLEGEVSRSGDSHSTAPKRPTTNRPASTAPKFEPPVSEPQVVADAPAKTEEAKSSDDASSVESASA